MKPKKLSIDTKNGETTLKFSGAYIMGILPRERTLRQLLHVTVICTPQAPGGPTGDPQQWEDCATKLHALLTWGEYRLLEHFVGHGLILMTHEWYDMLTQWTFTLRIAKPAALNDIATPVVSSTLAYAQEDLPPRLEAVTLPVAGSGSFTWFKGGTDGLNPPPDIYEAQVFLPTQPGGAKLLWQPQKAS